MMKFNKRSKTDGAETPRRRPVARQAPAPRVAILILAAGFGRRMNGADKLMKLVDDMPLLRRTALRAILSGHDVLVTVPGPDHPRATLLAPMALTLVPVPDNAEGMAASLRRGVAALPEACDAVMVVPADMPELTLADFARVIRVFQTDPDRRLTRGASADGRPGHPVLFPRRLFGVLQGLTGDQGARQIVEAEGDAVTIVALEGEHALVDLDTPEAWDAWLRAYEAAQNPPQ